MNDRFSATYRIRTDGEARRVADEMAGESSTATFVPIPGERAEIAALHGARVEFLEIAPVTSSAPSAGPAVQDATVTISWPLDNTGLSLPNILATCAGNLFDVRGVTTLRLLDVGLPKALASVYPGPQFASAGTKRLLGIGNRPLVGTIVKPSIGLTPAETAALVAKLADGRIDFIKDDELMADPPHSPFEQRVDAVLDILRRHEDNTGHRVMYAFNVTGEIDDMLRRHDYVVARGGNCIMASVNWIGVTGLAHLRRHAAVPIHGHRNGWGFMTRGPSFGIEFTAWQKMLRVAGVDHLHVNGLDNKFFEANESVIKSARACLAPVFDDGGPSYQAMPVFSSKQTVNQAEKTWKALRSTDLIFAAGGGILAHPDGVEAGVRSIREAWEAAVAGVPLDEYAADRGFLQNAIAAFA